MQRLLIGLVAVGVAALAFLASFALAAAVPPPAPVAALHYLVGTWHCTYRSGATRFAYDATWAYDRDGHTVRETTSWAGGGGDEELLAYDPQHHGWTAVIVEDQGAATILHGSGSDANHIPLRSVYPDAGIAESLARVSATEYAIHATVRAAGKATISADTCLRATP